MTNEEAGVLLSEVEKSADSFLHSVTNTNYGPFIRGCRQLTNLLADREAEAAPAVRAAAAHLLRAVEVAESFIEQNGEPAFPEPANDSYQEVGEACWAAFVPLRDLLRGGAVGTRNAPA
ncbi:MAG: hypothetical protein U0V56_12975 [Actinomycetota bacterium]